jgi:hypothetical protein
MRRSSGRSRATGVASVTAAVLLAVMSSPVSAGEPQRSVTGGGDDPSVAVEQTAADRAVTGWKVQQATHLRGTVERGAKPGPGGSAGSAGPSKPQMIAPCGSDCPPSSFALESWARQQITWYHCGPASAQVIINRTRNVVSSSTNGQSTTTNYRAQSTIAAFMGTNESTGTSSWMLRDGLNQYADLAASGSRVAFTVLDDIDAGADFHWAMVVATWLLRRGAAVPVQMTASSQHLASWTSTWWTRNPGATVRHWVSVRGYNGLWDGSYGPTLAYTDSAGGYGGQTGNFTSASRLVYNLNQANSGRIVY